MEKIDPFTNEKFTPKRRNQKFASRKNQIAYNNKIAQKIRDAKKFADKPLNNNRKVLSKILGSKDEKTFSEDYLLGAGLDFRFFSQSGTYKGQTIQMMYDYGLIKNDDKTFTIKRF